MIRHNGLVALEDVRGMERRSEPVLVVSPSSGSPHRAQLLSALPAAKRARRPALREVYVQ